MKIGFTETVLRDANQSLIATRLPMDKFESILGAMDLAGYYSVECWGGATFDACIRYLNEDPWERLKKIKQYMPNTRLQMLLRGQSLLGYKHYSDDVVRKFVYNSVEKGIDIIRIFDALNDLKNIETAVNETLKCEAHPSCAISYTVSPIHTIDSYVSLAKDMVSLGAQSICIKDMSGILSPQVAYELITRLKSILSVPIILHSHCCTGYASMTYLKAIEAGIDVLDTAISCFSGGSSQPATEVMARVATDFGRTVSLDRKQLDRINIHFEKLTNEYLQDGSLDPKVLLTSPKTIENQIPGGMYSNLLSQLKNQQLDDKLEDVLNEVIDIRKDLGYPPLVTPISQMVATQATVNVLMNTRYQYPIEEIKAYFRGEYGLPPGEVNRELMMYIVGTTEFPSERFSKSLPEVYDKVKNSDLGSKYGRSDILTLILFPDIGKRFLESRKSGLSILYNYHFSEYIGINKEGWCNITDTVSVEVKAIIIALIMHNLNKKQEEINLKELYEVK